jgi:hydroxymethylglutaryl-CoA synthase
MVSVGLAQNFAAIRAMSIEGIQRGHMNLHARNVAIQAGIPMELIDQAVVFMKVRNRIN